MAKEEKKEKPSGKKKLVLIGSGLLGLVVGAFAFVQMAVPQTPPAKDGEAEATDPTEEWKQERHMLEVLFVNLAGTNGKRYLRVGLGFAFSAKKPGTQIERFVEEGTLIRDKLITLLSGKKLEEIDGAENKRLLKREILEVLNETLFPEQIEGRVDEVYYNEFLVQ